MNTLRALLTAFLLLFPSISHACTVCFGGADGDLQRGFFWGIVLLGLLPFILLGGFIYVIVSHSRKNKPSSEVPS